MTKKVQILDKNFDAVPNPPLRKNPVSSGIIFFTCGLNQLA